MSQTVEPVREAWEPAPNRVRWTRRQCEALLEAEFLTGRYELIDGEILSKMGQKPPHGVIVVLLLKWLAGVFGLDFVRVQAPIEVGTPDADYNEPEPDLAVTRLPLTDYLARYPRPEELLLVAEVSDSTLQFDRTKKAALYARAGIQEYWVLDVKGRRLFVHRQPAAEGYQEITAYSNDESVATLARPDALIHVGDLLP